MTTNDDISQAGAGLWRIRAERAQGAQTAAGEAVVRDEDGAHTALAGARAWQAVAEACLAAGDTAGGIAAARAGLDELGDRYVARSLNVIDDTSQHIAMAEDQLEAGAAQAAAERFLRVLAQRLKLYTMRYAEALAE